MGWKVGDSNLKRRRCFVLQSEIIESREAKNSHLNLCISEVKVPIGNIHTTCEEEKK